MVDGWIDFDETTPNLGHGDLGAITIGEWTISTATSTGAVETDQSPTISIGNWTANPSFSDDLGTNLSDIGIAGWMQSSSGNTDIGLDSYSPHLFYDFAHFTSAFAATREYAELAAQLERTVIYYAFTPTITTVNAQGSVSLITPVSFGGIGCYIPQQENALRNSSFQLSAWYTAAGWELTNW